MKKSLPRVLNQYEDPNMFIPLFFQRANWILYIMIRTVESDLCKFLKCGPEIFRDLFNRKRKYPPDILMLLNNPFLDRYKSQFHRTKYIDYAWFYFGKPAQNHGSSRDSIWERHSCVVRFTWPIVPYGAFARNLPWSVQNSWRCVLRGKEIKYIKKVWFD